MRCATGTRPIRYTRRAMVSPARGAGRRPDPTPSVPYVTGSRTGRRTRPSSVAGALLLAAAVAFFLTNCSGAFFPFWSPRERLGAHLARDVGVPLPPSARVVRGTWQAYRDPGHHFEIATTPAEAQAFIAAVRAAGPSAEDADPGGLTAETGRPDWFRPQSLPSVRRLDVRHRDDAGGFVWYYAAGSGTVYLFWYRT